MAITIESIKKEAIEHQFTSYLTLVSDEGAGAIPFPHGDIEARRLTIKGARGVADDLGTKETWLVWETCLGVIDHSMQVSELFVLVCQHEDIAGGTSVEVFEIVHDSRGHIIDLVPIEAPDMQGDNWILHNPAAKAIH